MLWLLEESFYLVSRIFKTMCYYLYCLSNIPYSDSEVPKLVRVATTLTMDIRKYLPCKRPSDAQADDEMDESKSDNGESDLVSQTKECTTNWVLPKCFCR